MNAKHDESKGHGCQCPYCDHEIEETCFPFCEGCGITIFTCPDCGKAFPKEKGACPNCGAKVKE